MVEASSFGLADSLTQEERDSDLLYPRLERIREISAFIATRVIRKAQEEVSNQFSHVDGRAYRRIIQGVDRNGDLRFLTDEQLLAYVTSKMWNP